MDRQHRNPFEFEAANNLSDAEILDYYIDDHNYGRFINTSRNVFLQGARGTGKTMALLYNSFKIQYKKAKADNTEVDFTRIGIYIPCNTPLFHKKEHLLFEDDFKASLLTEHYLVLSMVNAIATALSGIDELSQLGDELDNQLKEQMEYILNIQLLEGKKFFEALSLYSQREIVETQEAVNNQKGDDLYQNTLTFSSFVMPFLNCIRRIEILNDTHFLLLIDDAHDLNKHQKQTINSWIAYRDHSQFSFKVATAETNPNFQTSTGGMILEGHDFVSVDMLKPYQNKESEFWKLANRIVSTRLEKYGINKSAEEFFPANPSFEADLEKAREKVKADAIKKYNGGKGTQIRDHVAKYTRAEYFRSRPPQANTPPYSGFQTIVDVSTGVIRNLLDPCYHMYDAELSNEAGAKSPDMIPYNVQQDILLTRGNKLWERLERLDKSDADCSEEQANHVFHLFENIMVLFKARLMSDISEPRAVTFVISEPTDELMSALNPLLELAEKAQLLYTRSGGKHKHTGKKVTVYVPNRILLLKYGLDPHGQYASVYLKARDLYSAAFSNQKIPFTAGTEDTTQASLFDGQ